MLIDISRPATPEICWLKYFVQLIINSLFFCWFEGTYGQAYLFIMSLTGLMWPCVRLLVDFASCSFTVVRFVCIFFWNLLAALSEIKTLLWSLITLTWNKSFHVYFNRTNVLQYEATCKKNIPNRKGTGKNAQTMTNVLQLLRRSMLPERLYSLEILHQFHKVYILEYSY